ncbi:MAG: archease [Candidatus Eisenbacteria sp.]|nr:archease [Candidatus Eisenbacteria bacterium]
MAYKLLDHGADLGIEIRAPSQKGLFVEGARALFDVIGTLGSTRSLVEEAVEIEGEDVEELLRGWLSEILFRCVARKRVFCDFEILELNRHRLRALARGEAFDAARHPFEREIKAVTFHGLEVIREAHGWRATVIFDV